MSYGERLRTIRAVRGLSQLELSVASGIANTYISDFERGVTLPSPDYDARLRAALRWPSEELAEIAFAILEGEIATVEELRAACAETVKEG